MSLEFGKQFKISVLPPHQTKVVAKSSSGLQGDPRLLTSFPASVWKCGAPVMGPGLQATV